MTIWIVHRLEDGGINSRFALKGGSQLQSMQKQTKHLTRCHGNCVLHHTSNQEQAQAYSCSQWQMPCIPQDGPLGALGWQHRAGLRAE